MVYREWRGLLEMIGSGQVRTGDNTRERSKLGRIYCWLAYVNLGHLGGYHGGGKKLDFFRRD